MKNTLEENGLRCFFFNVWGKFFKRKWVKGKLHKRKRIQKKTSLKENGVFATNIIAKIKKDNDKIKDKESTKRINISEKRKIKK